MAGYIYEYDKEGRMVNVYPAGEEREQDPAAPPVYRGLDEFLAGEESVGTKEREKGGEAEVDGEK
ncbi:MAG TPA: hypothetical protein VFG99_05480 [Chloroflexia bacterium]|nr:hypothetical protein [Chloroflexia bacterium]